MASFQAKIGWKIPRKRENKNFFPICYYPMRNRKFPKNCKQIEKTKKIPLWLLFQPKPIGTGQKREKIKIIVPISSYPTHYREFQKNSKNIKKTQLWLLLKPK